MEFVERDRLRPFVEKSIGTSGFDFRPLKGGLLNQNLIVRTDKKQFLLKVYRPEMDRRAVRQMHQVVAHCSARGIPVPREMADAEIEGFQVALYPFIQGEHPTRYRNTPGKITQMGAMLGEIHAALDTFKTSEKKPQPETLAKWDVSVFLDQIKQLRRTAKAASAVDRQLANNNLDIYERIVSGQDWPKEPFFRLPIRRIHGDYHTKNILFRSNGIVAVLDWEKSCLDWRPFEIMRSIGFNCRADIAHLSWPLVDTYLKAYRKTAPPLSELERQLTFQCGFRRQLFSLWAVKRFLEGETELKVNMRRRTSQLQTLAQHQEEYAERIQSLLE